jgi:hypothetical protein
MKRHESDKNKIENAEICKTIRKRTSQENQSYNTKKIEETTENNRNTKVLRKSLLLGKKETTAIKGKDNKLITNRDQILNRI